MLVQLRGLREEMTNLESAHEALTKRFDSIRRAVEGESFMGRVTAADIEERLLEMSARLDVLEAAG